MEQGKKLCALSCPKCKSALLESSADVAATWHKCFYCSNRFRAPGRRVVVGNPLAKVRVHDTERENEKNMCAKNGFSDFVTLQQSRMEGSTADSKLQSIVEVGDYVQQGSCKVSDMVFANLVQSKVSQIRECTLRNFKRDLKHGHFSEVFFCN